MRARVEPERIIAGGADILLAAFAAAGAVLVIPASLLIGFAPPDVQAEIMGSLLMTVAALAAFAVILVVLAAFVMVGRHARTALLLTIVILALATAILGVEHRPLALILLGVAVANGVALLIGSLRRLPR